MNHADVDLSALPEIPVRDNSPIFREPWEARAFAMAVKLNEAGVFEWREWVESLGAEIRNAQAKGDPDLGQTYYLHWLAALERIVTEKRITATEGLLARKDAWDRAAKATPHGEPIELGRDGSPVAPA
ncbi:nitrile hydratase accessory protein [Rhizobiales bacterium]|uniref:nitrile hydratase accessory protein n=1 Tax=Hongsoonwoonella zoysiae TaxID=2821844 RepID=UPI00155FFC86|nr:nitrile hydratase accessory protein [Hongsoonwoonella zoysiae]NRG17276.1 nitrile hydratase accessory protein [Hongsoonwoonella zoysiae]